MAPSTLGTFLRSFTFGHVRQLEAVVGIDGHVRELRAKSGSPFLMKAALDAVRQWIYAPTLLNGKPVEVISPITVTFRLGR